MELQSPERCVGIVLREKYRLDAVIGEGGMGIVFAAEHIALGRPVAVKILKQASADPDLIRRFLDEARIVATLRHPNVVDVLDVDTTDDADRTPFIVMERLDGETLADWLSAHGRTQPQEIWPVLGPAMIAVALAHENRVIHRDLKPENIFIHCSGRHRIPKVLDFGIAKLPDDSSDPARGRTTPGAVLGTAYFMAPEQARGEVGPWTDVWALGVIWFIALTGRYHYDFSPNAPPVGVLAEILVKEPRKIREVEPTLEPRIASLIDRALAHEVRERIQSVTEFHDALETLLGSPGELVVETSLSPASKIRISEAGGEIHEARTVSEQHRIARCASCENVIPAEAAAYSEDGRLICSECQRARMGSEDRRWAESDELQQWKEQLSRRALSLMERWESDCVERGVAPRFPLFGADHDKRAGLAHRFMGLFNLRAFKSKWVWISWDKYNETLVIIKEVRPYENQTLRESFFDWDSLARRLRWERRRYEDLEKLQQMGFRSARDSRRPLASAVVTLVATGTNWFATKLVNGGTLRQQRIGSSAEDESKVHRLVRDSMVSHHAFHPDSTDAEIWNLLRRVFVELAETVQDLHDLPELRDRAELENEKALPLLETVAHRDIHPSNILIDIHDADVGVYLCDFDRARVGTGPPEPWLCLDEWNETYTAPEILAHCQGGSSPDSSESADKLDRFGTRHSDVYSLAASLVAALLGRDLALVGGPERGPKRWIRALVRSARWPDSAVRLLTAALDERPERRPSAREFADKLAKIRYRRPLRTYAVPATLALGSIMIAIMVSVSNFWTSRCAYESCLPDRIVSDLTLESGRVYLLDGDSYVEGGATLKIEAGATVLAQPRSSLFVMPTGRIEAVGTAEQPIVFRPERDDQAPWGGLAVLGCAPVDARDSIDGPVVGDSQSPCAQRQLEFCDGHCFFGGDQIDHSSGRLHYIRLEHAGRVDVRGHEVNGFNAAGVGRGTRISHISVVGSEDDCFEFFGGTFDASYLICQQPHDDAFDLDEGYSGMLDYLLLVGGPTGEAQFSERGRFGVEIGSPGVIRSPGEEWEHPPFLDHVTLCGGDDEDIAPTIGVGWIWGDTGARIEHSIAVGIPASPARADMMEALGGEALVGLDVLAPADARALGLNCGVDGLDFRPVAAIVCVGETEPCFLGAIGADDWTRGAWSGLDPTPGVR